MSDDGPKATDAERVVPREISALRPAGGGERLKVYVDGQHVATVDSLRAHELDLRVGRKLENADLEAIEKAGQSGLARSMAMRWLSVRARSRAEIERRLIARKFDPEIARETVERLGETGLIDDEVFARLKLASMRRKGTGPRLVEHKLREMGLDRELIERVVRTEFEHADLDREAIELATARLERQQGRLQGDADVRTMSRRLQAFLARRGFEPQTCARAVQTAMREVCTRTEPQAEKHE